MITAPFDEHASSEEKLAKVDELLTRIRSRSLQSYDVKTLELDIATVLHRYEMWTTPVGDREVWFRGRICSDANGFGHLSEVLCRDAASTTIGRANLPHQPAFYGSWNRLTVFGECNVEEGDYIQVTTARSLPGVAVSFQTAGEIAHVAYTGRSLHRSTRWGNRSLEAIKRLPQAELLYRLYVDHHFATEFRRPHDGKPYSYKATAAYATHVFRAGVGVMYPSVDGHGGMNGAVDVSTFNHKFEIVSTEVWRIEKVYMRGVYETKLMRASSQFEPDGTIRWGTVAADNVVEAVQGRERMSYRKPLWRVPEDKRGPESLPAAWYRTEPAA